MHIAAEFNLMQEDNYDVFFDKLYAEFPDIVFLNISLASMSRWKIGGLAKCIVRPKSVNSLKEIISIIQNNNIPYIIIGSTTNLLFSDIGLNVLAIQITSSMSGVAFNGNEVRAEAGLWVPMFARKLSVKGLSGAEHICGIPGSLGGLLYMNGGSQRRSIGESVIEICSITHDAEFKRYTHEECCFGYRKSIFQEKNEIIVSATFSFEKKLPKIIKHEMLGILKSRRSKFPQKYPNCGSVFISNPEMYHAYGPPGSVIEKCGLKGERRGGAVISPMHANFIVNDNGATALDVLYLINLARQKVYNMTGYNMLAEAIYIDEKGISNSAHVVAENFWGMS